ncbi:MAG TPA: farnesyl diphosphate synthase [Opitutaceae bacterium]|nr:farnesyl diphosphate synthase [Opitutaceae bacterium]
MDHEAEMKRMVAAVEGAIGRLLPLSAEPSTRLHEAMRYSMQAGGKRLRPVLVMAASRLVPGGADPVPAAVAVECVHTYSLVHDDLPCMDDDDLRRGKPTAHKAFDEATALLAGDALLTRSFGILAESYAHDPALAAALVGELASAAGSRRLIGGQMEDLLAEKKPKVTPEALAYIHLNKTAAMIEASLAMGARCCAAPESVTGVLRGAGRDLGLAFQVEDDILDATSDSKTLGKTAGKDARAGKATYVSVHGLERARQIARHHSDAAVAALRSLPVDTGFLVWLVGSLVGRSH